MIIFTLHFLKGEKKEQKINTEGNLYFKIKFWLFILLRVCVEGVGCRAGLVFIFHNS